MAYGSFVVMRDISAKIKRGEIFIIMGGSGCGKSTLLRHMIGLKEPAQGDVFYDGVPFWKSDEEARTGEAAQLRRAVPGRRAVEFDDARGEHRPGAGRIHRVPAGGNPGHRPAEAGARRVEGLRGLLSGGDFGRHVQARRAGPRPRAGPGRSVLRRAVGRPRPDQLAQPRRADPATPRQPRRHVRRRHARAGQHFHNRRQLGFPRPQHPHDAGARQPARTAEELHRSRGAGVSHARRLLPPSQPPPNPPYPPVL